MWRSLFLALGVYLCILGAECLVVEKFVFRPTGPVRVESSASFLTTAAPKPQTREYAPREWAPWSLMATGVIVCLYSVTLAKRIGGK